MPHHLHGSFQCPLRGSCFAPAGLPFPSSHATNEAVTRYKSCDWAPVRRRRADQLYLRHLPLVGKTLARFCQRSRCYPGGCLIEELVGETYPIFRQVLDDYDVSPVSA